MTLYSYLITFSLTCGLRTVYLISLKNLICVDIVKMSSRPKVLSFTSFFTHNIISNNFSQHWRAARNQSDSTDVGPTRFEGFQSFYFFSHGLSGASIHSEAMIHFPLFHISPYF